MGVFGIAIKKPEPGGIDEYTKLMLHGDESPLVDSSLSPYALTLINSVARSAVESKFGGYSILFNGSNQYITVPDNPDWDITGDTTDYTVDFWAKHAAIGGSQIWASQVEPGGNDGWFLYLTGTGMTFQVYSGAALIINLAVNEIYEDTNWHHVALVKESTKYTFYKDGVGVGNITDVSTDTFSAPLQIGAYTTGNAPMNGYIDEFRWSTGIARWASDFTPRTSAYTT